MVTFVFLRISKKKMAPKIIKRISVAINKPRRREEAMREGGLYQKKIAMIRVINKVRKEILIKEAERRKSRNRQKIKNGNKAKIKRIKSIILVYALTMVNIILNGFLAFKE